ncbi:hypothetical protein PLUA15_420002 [Pseudomonas lundensis]|uniref:Uncharacterized protein n=1 Tax=Pseudomonas lundensis TaxID=86185 RepID=A0AAX2HBV4_9PSED|nr:hypothetical protein PLUA15_420002 [Pseudomonas lundensis]
MGGAAQACGTLDEAAGGVELDLGGALAVDGAGHGQAPG